VRASGGNVNVNWSYVETQGVPGDHADGLQCYGSGGNITVKNTTFRSHNNDATAGYFAADGWQGTHTFEDVLFWGGPYGMAIYQAGGVVSMKNVYFVSGSFGYGAFNFKGVTFSKWENVRWATIVDGKLVAGALIPQP